MTPDNGPPSHIWHYGLMAERWALFNQDSTPELPFLQDQIAQFGEPVLDLACGTGRLLLPLLRAGVDIDGCDASRDMLRHCRQLAGALPLTLPEPGTSAAPPAGNTLYTQAMPVLDLPRRYRLIYCCDSFGLAGSQALDLESLRHCRHHLRPGGALILNIEAEYAYPDAWRAWLVAERTALPQPWPAQPKIQHGPDGSEYRTWFRQTRLDPLTQTYEREVTMEKWQGEARVARETYTLRGRMYFHNEMLLLLHLAGFDQVTVYDGWREQPATADSKELIFVARFTE